MDFASTRLLGSLPRQFCRKDVAAVNFPPDRSIVVACKVEDQLVAVASCNIATSAISNTIEYLSFKEEIEAVQLGILGPRLGNTEQCTLLLIVLGASGGFWVFSVQDVELTSKTNFDIPNDASLRFPSLFASKRCKQLTLLLIWDFLSSNYQALEIDDAVGMQRTIPIYNLSCLLINYIDRASHRQKSLLNCMLSPHLVREDVFAAALIKFTNGSNARTVAPSWTEVDAVCTSSSHNLSNGVLVVATTSDDEITVLDFGSDKEGDVELKKRFLSSIYIRAVLHGTAVDVAVCRNQQNIAGDAVQEDLNDPSRFIFHTGSGSVQQHAVYQDKMVIEKRNLDDAVDAEETREAMGNEAQASMQTVLVNGPLEGCLLCGSYMLLISLGIVRCVDLSTAGSLPQSKIYVSPSEAWNARRNSNLHTFARILDYREDDSGRFALHIDEEGATHMIDLNDLIDRCCRGNCSSSAKKFGTISSAESYIDSLFEHLTQFRFAHDEWMKNSVTTDSNLKDLSSAIAIVGLEESRLSGLHFSVRPRLTFNNVFDRTSSSVFLEIKLKNDSSLELNDRSWALAMAPNLLDENQAAQNQLESFCVVLPKLLAGEEWSRVIELRNILPDRIISLPVYMAFVKAQPDADRPPPIFLLDHIFLDCLDLLSGSYTHALSVENMIHHWKMRIGFPKAVYGLLPDSKEILTSIVPSEKRSINVLPTREKSLVDALQSASLHHSIGENQEQFMNKSMQGFLPRSNLSRHPTTAELLVSRASGLPTWVMAGTSMALMDISWSSDDFIATLAAHHALLHRCKSLQETYRRNEAWDTVIPLVNTSRQEDGIESREDRSNGQQVFLKLSPIASHVAPGLQPKGLSRLRSRLLGLKVRLQQLKDSIDRSSFPELVDRKPLQDLQIVVSELRSMTSDMSFSLS